MASRRNQLKDPRGRTTATGASAGWRTGFANTNPVTNSPVTDGTSPTGFALELSMTTAAALQGIEQNIDVVSGVTYRWEVTLKRGLSDSRITIQITGGMLAATPLNGAAGSYVTYSGTFTPGSTTTVRVILRNDGAATTETIRVTKAMVAENGTYFDGSMAGYFWEGTADASISREQMLAAAVFAFDFDFAAAATEIIPPPPPYVYVRDKPPLRLSYDAIAPSGQHFRWGEDEDNPANVPTSGGHSSTMPGGHEALDVTLPRKSGLDYSDLQRLATIRKLGAGGEVAWEGRLEKAPRVSGDQMAVSPAVAGWQANLDDDKSASFIGVDRELGAWTGASRARRITLLGTHDQVTDPGVDADVTTGLPALRLGATAPWATAIICDAWYDAGSGNTLASVYFDWTVTNATSATWAGQINGADGDEATDTSGTDVLTGSASGTRTETSVAGYRFANAFLEYSGAVAGSSEYLLALRRVAVWGNHGLTARGTAPADGLYASDVIAYAISRWAPALSYTTGADGTIRPTAFVIPQLAFKEQTTVAEILRGANRFHLNDWAVWEGTRAGQPTFYYNERGARGRTWRARVGPSQLEETGPSVERLLNGVIVEYQDVDGTTKVVGPTGSGLTNTSADLIDTDPENPANQRGLRRWEKLSMGGVSTLAGATEVGRRYLIDVKQYDSSGRARLVGYVTDDKGVTWPAWKVRAGDTIYFTDAADKSPRRIVRAAYDDATRTNSIDLDAPPEGISALLERMQVVIAPLGL